jgi:hypothetical protein
MLRAQDVLSSGNLGIVLFHDDFTTPLVLKRQMGNNMTVMNDNFAAYCLVWSQN